MLVNLSLRLSVAPGHCCIATESGAEASSNMPLDLVVN